MHISAIIIFFFCARMQQQISLKAKLLANNDQNDASMTGVSLHANHLRRSNRSTLFEIAL